MLDIYFSSNLKKLHFWGWDPNLHRAQGLWEFYFIKVHFSTPWKFSQLFFCDGNIKLKRPNYVCNCNIIVWFWGLLSERAVLTVRTDFFFCKEKRKLAQFSAEICILLPKELLPSHKLSGSGCVMSPAVMLSHHPMVVSPDYWKMCFLWILHWVVLNEETSL